MGPIWAKLLDHLMQNGRVLRDAPLVFVEGLSPRPRRRLDQLWSAIEALPDPDQPSDTKRPSKQEAVIAMLQRPAGATVDEVASVMGWQHTVRGLFSGTLKQSSTASGRSNNWDLS
jgi:hypothetical protein